MRKFFPTAVLAVFFSLYLSGCYTQFGRPEPETGEKHSNVGYADDVYDYPGYVSPGFFGYPYYTLGYFYSPWWYDQLYYYIDEENRSDTKFIRYRGHTDPPPSPPSSGGILPPSNLPSTGEVKIRSGSDSHESGKKSEPKKKEKSKGKSTRRRR